MALRFKSICSGSSGNAALLWTKTTALLLDFAPGCQRDCRAALAEARKACPSLASVLVTHAHGDHINRNSLKVLREAGFKVRCHPEVALQIQKIYGAQHAPLLHPFVHFVTVGDLKIEYTQVSHVPGYCTTAFIITTTKGRRRKACLFTDLHTFTDEHVAYAAGSDLVLIEANHDLKMLAAHGHPGSEFHLSNLKAANFLHGVCSGGAQPHTVILGHLSDKCNRPDLPQKEIAAYFKGKGLPVKFNIHVSARYEPGPVIVVK